MKNEVSKEELQKVWLHCMQMNQCTSQAAIAFINQTHHLINTPLTNSGQTLLMVACSINSINLIRAAIGFKPNLNIKDNIGRTVLHYCAAIGSIQIFQLLVKYGANPIEQSIGGQTPLMKACLFSQGDIVEWYLNNYLPAFELGDKLGRKPLDVLKITGQALYQQVYEVYRDLLQQQSKMKQ